MSNPFPIGVTPPWESSLQGSDAERRLPLHVALIPGDGIGPEVMAPVGRLLEWARAKGLPLTWEWMPYGAEHYLRTGEALSESAFEHLRDHCDAILFGAVGDPRIPDGRHADALLLRLRRDLELGINYRPNRPVPPGLSPLKTETVSLELMEVFRENTEGPYVLKGRRDVALGIDEAWHSTVAIDRILEVTFARARQRNCRLTMAHKGNVLKYGHGLWLERFEVCRQRYPDVEAETQHADALLCLVVQNPRAFPLVVADNFLGDLISDLLAGLHGGMGLAPSASWAPHRPYRCHALFEPVHGSAPSLVGRDQANPMGALGSLAMCFRWAGWPEGAVCLEMALDQALNLAALTPDLGGKGTGSSLGNWIIDRVRLSSSA